jgi:hypothetical protein
VITGFPQHFIYDIPVFFQYFSHQFPVFFQYFD